MTVKKGLSRGLFVIDVDTAFPRQIDNLSFEIGSHDMLKMSMPWLKIDLFISVSSTGLLLIPTIWIQKAHTHLFCERLFFTPFHAL